MENTLEQINKSAAKFLVPLTTDETFKIIVDEAQKMMHGDFGTIFLQVDGELKQVYTDAEFFRHFKQRKRGNTYVTFTTMQPKVVKVDAELNVHPEIVANGIKTIIHIPLAYKDKATGVLTIHFKRVQDFTKKDLHLFSLYGSLASMAIRKTQLYDETKNALETRDLFISLASHELRTPLTALNGYIQLLHSRLAKKDTVEAKWMEALNEESKRLTSLVKELLEVGRIKQGQLQYDLRECNVNDLIAKALERYKFINKERSIQYTSDVSAKGSAIIGDCEKLMQMIDAILDNANKFSPKDKPIDVNVMATRSQVVISIKDYGTGVARSDLKKVFDGFYKGDSKDSQGLGVGLLLAKHIIQYHHGSIEMKSKKGKSTTVEIKLPRMKV